MDRISVRNEVTFDATDNWGVIRGVHESNEQRTLALDIHNSGSGYELELRTDDSKLAEELGDDLSRSHPLALNRAELWGKVQQCRQVWRRQIVERMGADGSFQFQFAWDFQQTPQLPREILPKLAEAGASLFFAIFLPRPPNPKPYESLQRVGRVLRNHLASESRCIRVVSDSFYVPWSLIYTEDPRDPSQVRPEGFLGYQHLIEHSPEAVGSMGFELSAARPLKVGLQLDDQIDSELKVECLKPIRELLNKYASSDLTPIERLNKLQLETALKQSPAEDQILYFCCHANQEGDYTQLTPDQGFLTLSDRPRTDSANHITPEQIRLWMDVNVLERQPIVFLNACQSGQMNSIFYKGFGDVFLGLHACSVIGPQTDIPAIFAGQFAKEFFAALFDGKKSIGRILFELRRRFLDRHNNPLGLVYSLYRGADTRLRTPVRPKPTASTG